MIRIMTVVGARPQFVKAAALSREFAKYDDIEEIIVHTGQHFDEKMSEVFFKEMEIPKPAYNLEINSLGHGAMTGRMLEGIEELLKKEQCDLLLVYGDTNSTIAGALAAKKMHIPVGHVEAGLRSFNMRMPEEVNRILTDRISDMLFCPTETAVNNLVREGFDNFDSTYYKTGDVMQDAAYYYAGHSEERSKVIEDLRLEKGKFILATMHRAENTDDLNRLKSICSALTEVDSKMKVVLPLHPRTKKIIDSNAIDLDVTLIDPVGYFDMLEMLKNCALVMTDSGGLQKEAFFFRKNCVTMRDQTEWVELVDHGFNRLGGADKDKILAAFNHFMTTDNSSDFSIDLYGGGEACHNIAQTIKAYFEN